jgi:hypothetical protein
LQQMLDHPEEIWGKFLTFLSVENAIFNLRRTMEVMNDC